MSRCADITHQTHPPALPFQPRPATERGDQTHVPTLTPAACTRVGVCASSTDVIDKSGVGGRAGRFRKLFLRQLRALPARRLPAVWLLGGVEDGYLVMGRSILARGGSIPGFRSGHRSFFQFRLNRGETGASVTEDYLRDWLRTRKRGVDAMALDEWDGEADVVLPSGAKVESIRFHDERSGQSAVRYRVTDAADEGHYRVSVSALTDRKQGEDVGFLVEVGRDSTTDGDTVKSTHPPRTVPNILDSREVVDGVARLEGGPRVVQVGDVDELLSAVADQDREVPLLVAVSPARRLTSVGAK